jgi:hypothetical protein
LEVRVLFNFNSVQFISLTSYRSFLWQFIKLADLFISHPVNNFIPDEVPRRNVVLLPACTDPLDGLNKNIKSYNLIYYRSVFNRVCMDQGANEVDWSRPYIVQVARFDPSKGMYCYTRLVKKRVGLTIF